MLLPTNGACAKHVAIVLLFVVVAACVSAAASPIETFNEWFLTNATLPGFTAPVTFAASPGRGLGVFVAPYVRRLAAASKDESRRPVLIARGSTLLKVRMSAGLCDDCLQGRPYRSLLSSELKDNEEYRLVLSLAFEIASGPASPLSPWMAILPGLGPSGVYPPAVWPDTEIAKIEPRSMRDMVRQSKQLTEDTFRRLKNKGVIGKLNDLLKAQGSTEHIDAEGYMRALVLVNTRAWNLNGRKYLFPGADLFNHAPDDEDRAFRFSHVTLAAGRSQKFTRDHRIDTRGGFGLVLSDRDVVDGGDASAASLATPLVEVHESYGDNPDDIYFQYHGFIPSEPETASAPQPPYGLPQGRNHYDCQRMAFIQSALQSSTSPFATVAAQRIVETFGAFDPSAAAVTPKDLAASSGQLLLRLGLQYFGGSICVFYDTTPYHWLLHGLLSFMPPSLFKTSSSSATGSSQPPNAGAIAGLSQCLSQLFDDIRKRNAVPIQRNYGAALTALRECLDKYHRHLTVIKASSASSADDDGGASLEDRRDSVWLHRWYASAYGALLNLTGTQLRQEFPTHRNCTAMKRRIRDGLADGSLAATSHHVQRMRFATQRVCIVESLRESLRGLRKVHLQEIERHGAAAVSGDANDGTKADDRGSEEL